MFSDHDTNNIDTSLLKRIAKGDTLAFTDFVVSYTDKVRAFIHQHTKSDEWTDEAVQDIFIQIWLSRDSLPTIRNVDTYLYVLCRNHAFNILRNHMRRLSKHREWQKHQYETIELIEEEETHQDWRQNLLDEAVSNLPPQQQKVWILSRKQARKQKEVAEEMDLSLDTVKKYLQLATLSITKYIRSRIEVMILIMLSTETEIFFTKIPHSIPTFF